MESNEGRMKYWNDMWSKGVSPWHSNQPHDYFVMFYDRMVEKLDGRPGRFFLPLCGKAGDIKWLYDKGHTVVGVDGVKSCLLEFFQENKVEFEESPTLDGKGSKLQSKDGRIILYECDFFSMNPEMVGDLDGIFDRGSLVAIYPEDRLAYVEMLRKILVQSTKDWRYLLATYDYDQSAFPGPPRSVPKADVEALFDQYCKVEMLGEFDHSKDGKVKFNLDRMMRQMFLLTSKE